MAGPEQFGKGSVWGMIKNLANFRAGFFTNAGPPTNGASGTFAGKAGTGAELFDITNGLHYTNVGTLASPFWQGDGAAGVQGATNGNNGGAGAGSVVNAKATYDFATDGGATATITPVNSPTIPNGAIVLGGVLEVLVIAASGGAPTISCGIGTGANIAALVAAAAFNAAPWSTTGMKAIIPIFTAATYFKNTAAGALTFTIAGGTLTGGRFSINICYIQGN